MANTAEKVSLILTSTNASGTTKQKSFTDISPDATNAELLAFSRAVNMLTDNVYGRTDKVMKIHVDSDPSGGKQTPTIKLLGTGDVDITGGTILNRADNTVTRYISYDGDASNVYFDFNPSTDNLFISPGTLANGTLPANMNAAQAAVGNYTLHIYAPETDNFKAANISVPVTVQ